METISRPGDGKHLEWVTSPSADTNSQSGKSRLDSGCGQDGGKLPSNNNHVTAEYYLISAWPGPPPPPVPNRADDMSNTDLIKRQDMCDHGGPGWGWPGVVVMFVVLAMTFLHSVISKAKHHAAICPSWLEHNSEIETSASNDKHSDT